MKKMADWPLTGTTHNLVVYVLTVEQPKKRIPEMKQMIRDKWAVHAEELEANSSEYFMPGKNVHHKALMKNKGK